MAAEVLEQTGPEGRPAGAAGATFLVTGAHGFIGAWVTKRLLGAGARVVLFDRDADPRRLRLIMDEDEVARATVVTGDITDPRALPLVNVVGTVNVFEAARLSAGRVKRIVYASSAAVYGSHEDGRAVSE